MLQTDSIIWRRSELLGKMSDYKFKNMVATGELQRIHKGIYTYRGSDEPDNDMVLVQQFFPQAIFSIFTAASYHDLTTVIPRKVQITLPSSGTRRFVLPDYPPIEIFFSSDRTMSLGAERVELEGQMVSIYNRERTVCDMFRYLDKTGLDTAIEVFKAYMADIRGRNIQMLMEYAKKLRVYKYISQYVEVTVG
ncbi:MAG: hypothetical protein IKR28_03185 [Selenomonadaceae bacterium]|nr:hypothetical protein [Selenomonadaceae bacterium]